ncbi:hypothetical protein PUN4_230012 [Paraburkholderia unamae]|nr:hypothetical protein PUN4_230012 [Paraburkholderia unamae]
MEFHQSYFHPLRSHLPGVKARCRKYLNKRTSCLSGLPGYWSGGIAWLERGIVATIRCWFDWFDAVLRGPPQTER